MRDLWNRGSLKKEKGKRAAHNFQNEEHLTRHTKNISCNLPVFRKAPGIEPDAGVEPATLR
jgi:hypothetical protein